MYKYLWLNHNTFKNINTLGFFLINKYIFKGINCSKKQLTANQ